ncbi:hypothetical protein [Herbaspirillum lusitanum]|nr:hypothetical protein [Herbaspirillum lusitanum]
MGALLDVGTAAAEKFAAIRMKAKIDVRANILGLQKFAVNLKSG